MKKSTKLISVLVLLLLSLFPNEGHAISCKGPEGYFSVGCNETFTPMQICEGVGYKLSEVSGSIVYCMDKNCAFGDREDCVRCDSGFSLSGSRCVQNHSNSCPQGYYFCPVTNRCSSCPPTNCASCTVLSSSLNSVTTRCNSCFPGYLKSGGKCIDCPANAECNGSSTFTCNSGYSNVDGKCVKNEQEPTKTNTVNSCPSRMTLSSDGCCCINK